MNVPAWGTDDATSMVRVTASRSVMGPAKVTVTGIATPTVVPEGWMATTSVGVVTPAELVATDPVTVIVAMPSMTRADRTAFSTQSS